MFKHVCSSFHKHGLIHRPMALLAIIIGVIAALSSAHHAKAATPYPDATHERFSVAVSGSGPDIILIPGLASPAAVWDGTVAHLDSHYRVHVLNLAGFAGEPAGANADGDVLAPSVEALDAYIKAEHLDHPVLIGHSLGGLMALMLAKSHPEDAGRLIIADSLPFAGLMMGPQASVAAIEPQAKAMRDGVIALPADAFKAQQQATLARMTTSDAHRDLIVQWSLDSDRRVLAQAFYEDLTTDLRPDLPGMTLPIAVIYPVDVTVGQVPVATAAFYKAVYAGAPKVAFTQIDACRHFMMLDQPDAFYTAIDAALK
ncbi:MAG: alpha/beta fold hydrolase [Asticcacaulis sp.]|uniref:alpha/beta fold hydrolase n=1 Tax=Asticcacaulis sp. TaxID=1872648 RepID=UPI003F7C1A79